MRHWINLMEDLAAPEMRSGNRVPLTDYGYWVAPDGEIHLVGESHGHGKVIRALGYFGSDHAIRNGWARIVAQDSLNEMTIEINSDISRNVIDALGRIAASYRPIIYYLDIVHPIYGLNSYTKRCQPAGLKPYIIEMLDLLN